MDAFLGYPSELKSKRKEKEARKISGDTCIPKIIAIKAKHENVDMAKGSRSLPYFPQIHTLRAHVVGEKWRK